MVKFSVYLDRYVFVMFNPLYLAAYKRDFGEQRRDPDQTPQDVLSDQGLHWFHLGQEMLSNILQEKLTRHSLY